MPPLAQVQGWNEYDFRTWVYSEFERVRTHQAINTVLWVVDTGLLVYGFGVLMPHAITRATNSIASGGQ